MKQSGMSRAGIVDIPDCFTKPFHLGDPEKKERGERRKEGRKEVGSRKKGKKKK